MAEVNADVGREKSSAPAQPPGHRASMILPALSSMKKNIHGFERLFNQRSKIMHSRVKKESETLQIGKSG
jgi:hypothetical protein